jgi:NTF2 fold immunity protein
MNFLKLCLILIFAFSIDGSQAQEKQNSAEIDWNSVEASIKGAASFKPEKGLVPDDKTAIKVAEAVLQPIYGEQKIISERPFNVHLSSGIWTVVGTMHSASFGGVAIVKISRSDGRVLFVGHGQ